MNITLNTQNYNLRQNYLQSNRKSYAQPSFGASVPLKSEYLSSAKEATEKGLGVLYKNIAQYFTKPLYESGIAVWLSQRAGIGKIVNHMQSLGSIIISGMYMSQTLRSDMEDDTKKKLALNQGMTWLFATIGAYIFDDALDEIWDKKVNIKFAKRFLGVKDLPEQFEKYNENLKIAFDKNIANAGKKFKPETVLDFLKKHDAYKNETLLSKIGGLNILKSLAVFGTVYRFLSPVAVTPLANILGDWMMGKSKKTNGIKPEINQTQLLKSSMPSMQAFIEKK